MPQVTPLPEPPPDLIDAIKSNHAVAFVGSGLSSAGGAPSWRELLAALIRVAEAQGVDSAQLEAVECLLGQERLVDAATAIRSFLSREAIEDAIVQTFNHPDRRINYTDSHKALLTLNLQAIITTNYDRLLEAALDSSDIVSYSWTSFARALPIRPWQPFILHIHGDIKHNQDIVLSVGDYAVIAGKPAFEYVEKLLSTTVTLWMGYSHSDPDFAFALSPFRFSHSFQIVRRCDTSLISLCIAKRITPILLETYDQIPAFIASLAQKTGARSHKVAAFVGAGAKPKDPATLNPLGLAATNQFLSELLSRLPRQPIDPRVVLLGQERQMDPKELFQIWTAAPVPGIGRKIAIVAPPATGKTVLLSRFAEWLLDQFQPEGIPTPRHLRLFPIILFLTADNLSETVSRESPLWEQVERWAQGPIAGYHEVETRGVLDPWLEKGAVYLLFDGLDEFGARRRGELEDLLWHLSELVSEKGITVLLTCREVFWNQQVRASDKASWEEIGILPFTPEEIERIVPRPGLGRFAYDTDGKPKRGVLNRQLVSFVLALKRGGQSPESFESRYQLFSNWAMYTAVTCGKRFASDVPAEEWLVLFKNTALNLLRHRLLSVPLPGLQGGRSIPYHQIAATGILTPSADGRDVKFYHESINEFFVSWVLVENFWKVLDSAISLDTLSELPLAHVDLDFLQTSLHGFLHEVLGSDYVRNMIKAVERSSFMTGEDRTTNLMRNLVEYVGITFEGGYDTNVVVDWLLGLMRRSELSPVIRYNAARALERIHPRAPKPYFDYMSDWGDRDWRKERNEARGEKLCPWAIRGYYKKKGTDKEGKESEEIVGRRPGKWPALFVLRTAPVDPNLQAHVSKELARMLVDLLERLPSFPPPEPKAGPWRHIDWLLINYSHTWVRWYCADHRDLLKTVRDLAKVNGAGKETIENLFQWVDHKGFRNA